MGVSYGIGPNGQFGPIITFDPPSYQPPSEYDYRFETEDGVIINVNVETENAARAETVRLQLTEKMGWHGKPLEEEDDGPTTWGSVIADALAVPLVVAMVVCAVAFVGFIMADAFDWIEVRDFHMARLMLRLALTTYAMSAVYLLITGYGDLKSERMSATVVPSAKDIMDGRRSGSNS